jgi:hypothetical protein
MVRALARADRDAANRYGLVVILLGLAYVTSVTADGNLSITLVMLVELITLWLTFSVSESPTAQRLAGIGCLIVGAMAVMGYGFGRQFNFDATAYKVFAVLSVLLYLLAPALILRHLLRRNVVDARTILGAIAVYIMLGMMFAFSYRAIGVFQVGTPFFEGGEPSTTANYLFFSFVTLTTTGYGDLVPTANPGQSVAVLEAIVGQLFLVTALAKIVSAWRMPGFGSDAKPQ